MKVEEIIADKLIKSLEAGEIPWQKPWKTFTRNITGYGYNGINSLLLFNEKDTIFASFKQIQSAGLKLRKGSKGIFTVFFKVIEKEVDGQKKTIPFLRYSNVFRLSDCDGDTDKIRAKFGGVEHKPIEEAEELIERFPVTIGGNRAYYNKADGTITIPHSSQYANKEEYYKTAFHEIAHLIGDREEGLKGSFGSDSYAFEELIADITANILASQFGIDISNTFENTAAYIQSWVRKLEDKPRQIIKATKLAEKRAALCLEVD